MNHKPLALIAIILGLALCAFAWPADAAVLTAPGATIIGQQNEITTTITLADADGCTGVGLVLIYDPTTIQPVNVSGASDYEWDTGKLGLIALGPCTDKVAEVTWQLPADQFSTQVQIVRAEWSDSDYLPQELGTHTFVISSVKKGDIDGDGQITSDDILETIRLWYTHQYNPIADYDGDGRISIGDIVRIITGGH